MESGRRQRNVSPAGTLANWAATLFFFPKRDAKNKALLCADIVTHVAHLPLCVTRGCQEREEEEKNSKVRKQWTSSSWIFKVWETNGLWCALRSSVLVPLRTLFFKTPNEKQDCVSSDPASFTVVGAGTQSSHYLNLAKDHGPPVSAALIQMVLSLDMRTQKSLGAGCGSFHFPQSRIPEKREVGYGWSSVEDCVNSWVHQRLISAPSFVPACC